MSPKLFCLIGGVIFLVIAVGHALRLIFGFTLVVSGFAPPVWASWFGLVVAGYLAFAGLSASRKTA